jgi:hypothetical protein
MWTCPKCGRSFRVRNQPHSCKVTDADHHFRSKSPVIREIYDRILSTLRESGPVRVSFVKNAIIIAARSTFLAIKPRKSYVEVEFILDREIAGFPIYKTFRVSKFKVAHFLRIESPAEVDETVINWLSDACRLNAGE